MANIIENDGRWGPIKEGSGPIFELSYTGKEIVIDFDNSTTSGIHYTAPIGVPISTETEFIWNTEAINWTDTADMTICLPVYESSKIGPDPSFIGPHSPSFSIIFAI